jgi:hypothetical protein
MNMNYDIKCFEQKNQRLFVATTLMQTLLRSKLANSRDNIEVWKNELADNALSLADALIQKCILENPER